MKTFAVLLGALFVIMSAGCPKEAVKPAPKHPEVSVEGSEVDAEAPDALPGPADAAPPSRLPDLDVPSIPDGEVYQPEMIDVVGC